MPIYGFIRTSPVPSRFRDDLRSASDSTGVFSSSARPVKSADNRPRLPLIGVRAIVAAGLKLVLDGNRRRLSIRTAPDFGSSGSTSGGGRWIAAQKATLLFVRELLQRFRQSLLELGGRLEVEVLAVVQGVIEHLGQPLRQRAIADAEEHGGGVQHHLPRILSTGNRAGCGR